MLRDKKEYFFSLAGSGNQLYWMRTKNVESS